MEGLLFSELELIAQSHINLPVVMSDVHQIDCG